MKQVPFDPLFPAADQKKTMTVTVGDASWQPKPEQLAALAGEFAAADLPKEKPLDLLAVSLSDQQTAQQTISPPGAYTHIDAFTCPARGCGKAFTRSFLANGEEVSYCDKHRIVMPLPLPTP